MPVLTQDIGGFVPRREPGIVPELALDEPLNAPLLREAANGRYDVRVWLPLQVRIGSRGQVADSV